MFLGGCSGWTAKIVVLNYFGLGALQPIQTSERTNYEESDSITPIYDTLWQNGG
jgi:hypothetical protein